MIIFILPLFILSLFSFVIIVQSGEHFTKIDTIVKSNKDYLIGFANDEHRYRYLKWATINNNKKFTILALGSSRVLQFKEDMFEKRFYNAGYTVENINEFKDFLETIPKIKLPKYLIIGVDQWMLNENWNGFTQSYKPKAYWANNSFSFNSIRIIDFYKNILDGTFNLYNYNTSSSKVGFNAKFNNIGFRKDGSMNYGSQITKLINNDITAIDYLFRETFFRINNNSDRFEYGEDISLLGINKLKELLDYCYENNIKVVGFLPPFPESIYEKMIQSENYKYIEKIPTILNKMFASYNYEFYDYTSFIKDKTYDIEYLDGFHGSEVTYYRILFDMLKSKSILNKITNINKIKSKLDNRVNSLQID